MKRSIKSMSVVFVLFATSFVFGARVVSTTGQTAVPQQNKKKAAARPQRRSARPTKKAVVRKPVREAAKPYEQILNMIKTTQPTIEDYPLLMNIDEEVDRQINSLQIDIQVKPNDKPSVLELTNSEQPVRTSPLLQTHLVPTDAKALKAYDLCPLFGQTQRALNEEEQALAKELRQQGSSEESIAQFFGKANPHYYIFDENHKLALGETGPGFDSKNVEANAPCVVPLGQVGSWNRTLMQLKSLDQVELSESTGLPVALCAGHSLNNGRLIRTYAITGNNQYLTDLHSVQKSVDFLRHYKFGEWLYAREVKQSIAKLAQELGVDGVDVSAISTVCLFESNLDKKPEFATYDQSEFQYVQKVKKNIQEGLKRNDYVHIMIIGNEEMLGGKGSKGMGHYFCFAIIKSGNEVEYVVLDTISSTYHLQAGSHERNQLMFVIENIENGKVITKVPSVQAKLYLKNLAQGS